MLNAIFMALSLLVVADTSANANHDEGELRLPNCAVSSTYSMLRCLGDKVAMTEVEARYKSNGWGTDEGASVLDVRAALESFGVKTRAVQVQSHSVREIAAPAILYFAPGCWQSSSPDFGHFVTLTRQENQTVSVLDWSGLEPEKRFPRGKFEAGWDGVAIVLERADSLSWGTALAVSALVALMGAGWWWVIGRRRAVTGVALLICLGIGLNSGCGKAKSVAAPISPVVCTNPVQQFGDVNGAKPINAKFKLHVHESGPVKITGFSKSCGCTSIAQELVGQTLAAGTDHEVAVTVNPDGDGAETMVRTVELLTDPKSPTPVLMAVRFRRRDPPRVSANEILLEGTPQQAARGVFQITHRRGEEEPQTLLVENKCLSQELVIERVTTRTEVVDRGASTVPGKLAIDRTEVTVAAKALHSYGEPKGMLKLVFADNSEQMVPVRIHIPHPFVPQVTTVYAGRVRAGESWTKEIPVRRSLPEKCTVREVTSSVEQVTATMTDDGKIRLTGIGPTTAGRFAGEIIIAFAGDAAPPVKLPFFGIVVP